MYMDMYIECKYASIRLTIQAANVFRRSLIHNNVIYVYTLYVMHISNNIYTYVYVLIRGFLLSPKRIWQVSL